MNIFKPNTTHISPHTQHEIVKNAKHLVNQLQDNTNLNSYTNFSDIVNNISLKAAENTEEAGLLTLEVLRELEHRIADRTLNSPVAEFEMLDNGKISQAGIDLLIKTIINNEYFPLPADIQMNFNKVLVDIAKHYRQNEHIIENNFAH